MSQGFARFFVIFWVHRGAIIPYGSLGRRMKTLLVAATIALTTFAFWAAPAYSQGLGGSRKHHGQAPKTEAQKPKVDDKGYNAALARIPTPDKKYDPWQSKR